MNGFNLNFEEAMISMKNNKMVAGERFVEGLFLYMDDEGDVWLADVNNELLKQPFHYSESSKNQMFSII